MDLTDLDRIRANAISPQSTTIYRNSISRFLLHLFDTNPSLLSVDAVTTLQNSENRQQAARTILDGRLDVNHPIRLGSLSPDDHVSWLLSLRTSSGGQPSSSTYSSHRSALFHLYRECRVIMSAEFNAEMKTYFRGLKRDTARRIANGDGEIRIGKDPLPMGLYKFIGISVYSYV